ncbi:hypothetical protein D030_3039B, partial [Vibrio parahaemolyticus AQ3810]
QD